MENTVVQAQYEGLIKLVEDLKTKLIDERKKNMSLEKNLREELCNEFNQMLVEVEQGYEQRNQDQISEAKRVNEWRIGELNNVHSRRNKRKDADAFDEELETFRLKSQLEEKTKVESVLVQELEDLKLQVEAMKDATMKSKAEQDKLEAANSKVQFELADQQRLAGELGRELASTEARLVEERRSNKAIREGETDALLESERQLAEAREELAKKEGEVSDLEDLIQEAKDEFIMKLDELQEAQKECQELKRQVAFLSLDIEELLGNQQECHILQQVANNRLEDKERKIEQLEQELETKEEEEVKTLKKELKSLQKEVDSKQNQHERELKRAKLASDKVSQFPITC